MREKLWYTLVISSFATAAVLSVLLMNSLSAYGPWWLWASDACPSDPNAICGMIPIGPFLVAAGVVVVLSFFIRLLPAPEVA